MIMLNLMPILNSDGQKALMAIKTGGTAPAVLNGGNEELVSMFLSDKIRFFEIPEILDVIMNETDAVDRKSVV